MAESKFTHPFYPKQTVKRGEKLRVEWLRQNHPGGFVRVAFTTFSNSDSEEAFSRNVAKYVCYETNCGEAQNDPVLGHLNGKGDMPCSTYVTVPDNLPDGAITMQWIWFGGGVYFSQKNTTFANYHNCADMELIGGNTLNSESQTQAIFQGGDVATSDPNKCRYWGSNRVGQCAQGFEDGNSCGVSDPKFGPPDDNIVYGS